jgi:hypothetical protein
MSYATLLTTLIPVVAGATIGFAPALLLQRRTQKHEIITRWDSTLLTASVDLINAARRADHLAERVDRGLADDGSLEQYDDLHQQARVSTEQIRLLGNAEVQVAARNVLRCVYSMHLILLGEPDPYAKEYGDSRPSDRLRDNLLVFYIAVRQQLRVDDALDVPRDSNPGPFVGDVNKGGKSSVAP